MIRWLNRSSTRWIHALWPALLIMTANVQAAPQARAVIEATQRTVISSEIAGRIEALPRRAGEAFDRGDTLVQLGCDLYRAQRDKVSARLAQARRKAANRERLAKLNSVGKLEVDLARLAVKEARAKQAIARIDTGRCTIIAPFDGRVVKLDAREHQSVKAQQKVLQIVGRSVEARIIVPADWLRWLQPDMPLHLHVGEIDRTVSGRVARIGATVDPVSHTIPVWATLDHPDVTLRPGMSGRARFPANPIEGDQ